MRNLKTVKKAIFKKVERVIFFVVGTLVWKYKNIPHIIFFSFSKLILPSSS